MWSRITSVLKSRVEEDDATEQEQASTSRFNLTEGDEPQSSPSPPGSPSRRRSVFKRLSKLQLKDSDSIRAPSPSPNGQSSKKVKTPLFSSKFGTTSQLSLSHSSADLMNEGHPELSRRSSQDMLRVPGDSDQSDTTKKGINIFRRPSLDILRSKQRPSSHVSGQSSQDEGPDGTPVTPSADFRFGSVRSILRNPKTPGSGQNVRFFSRDAYKVISPENSADAEGDYHSMAQSPQDTQTPSPGSRPAGEASYYMTPEDKENSPLLRSTNSKSWRPSVTEVFSSLTTDATIQPRPPSSVEPLPPADFDDSSFDMPQNFNMPHGPPGLGFNVHEPSMDMSLTDRDETAENAAVTSTPFRDNKGKGRAMEVDYSVEHDIHSASVAEVETMLTTDNEDDATFTGHRPAQSASPRTRSPPLHDRSQSFSFGQTMFHSVANDNRSANTSLDSSNLTELYNTAADLKPSLLEKQGLRESSASPSFGSIGRSRAISDSIFHSAFRSPPTTPQVEISNPTAPSSPERPDPFSANAKTYYTPQTMIPVTPPSGKPARSARKTSKEESIIFSLQTQLALQTELCGQYETDLRAKDELVAILGKKVSEFEKEDSKRRSLLKSWKKKVQELERTCRYLEEEVDGSRRDSMERSIMDEASEQALRMLHVQMAALEKEKKEWKQVEESLRGDLARVEDTLQRKEDHHSVGEEDRSLQKTWEAEKAELLRQIDEMAAEQVTLRDNLTQTKERLVATVKDHDVLKAELNAQWEHTEKASEKIGELERKSVELEKERDALQRSVQELEVEATNTSGLDDRRLELEAEVQDLWNQKEELEREKQQIEDDLLSERNQIEDLSCAIQEREDRISELTQDLQVAQEGVAHMEAQLQERETELEIRTRSLEESARELRYLREEVDHLNEELAHATDEDTRAKLGNSSRESEMRDRLDELSSRHASVEGELRRHKDKVASLEAEIEVSKAQVRELQKENANKDVKLLQAAKKREEDRADLAGMNMALDAKQQELELIKRKMDVKGTGGSSLSNANSAATRTRRESNILNTPSVTAPRPSSSLSNASNTATKRKPSLSTTGSSDKLVALATSNRVNGVRSPTNSTTSAKRPEAGVSAAVKARTNAANPPSSAVRIASLSRTSTSTASLRSPPSDRETSSSDQERTVRKAPARPLRQSMTSPSAPRASVQGEKENVDFTRRQGAGPLLA